ncbi:sugar ABC transporter substrate-binding protein [Avibacterium paragallinarum]|uniref:sugar ABC transporter substrate-binding protein n=1 Tax=Avibacterium paragallinarum TaxID=728 RepID=UPI00021AD31D|nr:sugar ABC transporter substrate-binding protein [Avibacterium paragallinarum]QIR12012.1 sugar ABC transporter substrate-binding protein [Avibacterium paragallinarum]QJE09168.1 sugar ABC transporter substrate-binding protein [Avibacterium paragallinarum]QJE11364.1 sugar ABC transporter substrate-binding protein [Avibacterium paragallinarum]QJE13562.1 sugar ABC transporter substrate-binding protein [Avibacterium paragallinarum]QJE15763.1 sugar ABC transporter substrate-binding protein [Avibac
MLKKIGVLLLGVLFIPALFAKPVVIGVAMYSLADKYPTYLQEAMQKFEAEHQDVKLKFADANGDPAKMLNDVENFIGSNVNAIIIMLTDPKIAKSIGIKARKAKIPLIAVTVKPNDEDMKYLTSYVGSEEITSGKMQAEFVLQTLNGKPANAIILLGPLGLDAQIKRTEGNKAALSSHPEIHIIAEQEAKWDRAKAMEVAENLFAAHKKINVVFANNDEMAIGALLAARKMGIKDEEMIIVGIDATPDALAYLGNGLDATVFQSASDQGRTSVELAYRAAKGESVPLYNWIPFELVTPEKKVQYINKYYRSSSN